MGAGVEAALAAIGVRLDGAWGHTLVHPDDLPFALDALPDVRDGLAGNPVPWRDPRRDADAAADLARWTAGTTGFPLVDAAMRELRATGYTSNRARQNVASFLTKNLGVDWRAGAEWFEAMLIDHDPASNWGNWAYAAGVGNDARGFRFFNLHRQADAYDPDGDYVRHWVPELAGVRGAAVHRPERLHPAGQARAGVRLGTDYPPPMVDLFASPAEQERRWTRAAQAAGAPPGRTGQHPLRQHSRGAAVHPPGRRSSR